MPIRSRLADGGRAGGRAGVPPRERLTSRLTARGAGVTVHRVARWPPETARRSRPGRFSHVLQHAGVASSTPRTGVDPHSAVTDACRPGPPVGQ